VFDYVVKKIELILSNIWFFNRIFFMRNCKG